LFILAIWVDVTPYSICLFWQFGLT